jgi:hypothetical protein
MQSRQQRDGTEQKQGVLHNFIETILRTSPQLIRRSSIYFCTNTKFTTIRNRMIPCDVSDCAVRVVW